MATAEAATPAELREAPFAVLKVTATWCGPCREIHPKFVDIANSCPRVATFVLDVDKAQQEGDEAQAMLDAAKVEFLPTFLAYQAGVDRGRVEGSKVKELQALMAQLQEEAAGLEQASAQADPAAREVSVPILERESRSARGAP